MARIAVDASLVAAAAVSFAGAESLLGRILDDLSPPPPTGDRQLDAAISSFRTAWLARLDETAGDLGALARLAAWAGERYRWVEAAPLA